MKVNLIQTDIFWNNPTANVEALWAKLESEKLTGLVALPEMFTTGFSFLTGEKAKEAEKIGSDFLLAAAKKFSVYICGSLPLLSSINDKPTNTLRLYGPEGHILDYSKIHLFTYDGEDTKYGGGVKTATTTLDGIRTTFAICYDLRFPRLFELTATETDLYVLVANWPGVREAHWNTLVRARAIENQSYFAAVNRIGKGGDSGESGESEKNRDGMNYVGGSLIISPTGETLAKGEDQEMALTATIDSKVVTDWRTRFTCLKDRKEVIYRTFSNTR